MPDTDPQTLVFADGSVALTIDYEGEMMLGDQVVSEAFALLTADLDPMA